MKAKFFLIILIAGLMFGASWYYNTDPANIPSSFETTIWAKQHVKSQLSSLKKSLTKADIEKAYVHLNSHLLSRDLVYFQIRDGKVSFKIADDTVKNKSYFKLLLSTLTKLGKQKHLVDNDFIVALRDRTEDIHLPKELNHIPLFVFTKNTAEHTDVIKLLMVDPLTLDKWNSIYATLAKGLAKTRWSQRINKLFWRGKTTDTFDSLELLLDTPQVNLAKLTRQHRDRYDAQLTQISTMDKEKIAIIKEECGAIAPFATIADHLCYKYLMSLDGITASFPGYLWRIASGSVTFKQESTDVQWFYDLLQPMVHYVPVAHDLSNLDMVVLDGRARGDEMQEMAKQARLVVENELTPEKVFGYFIELLNQYASKIHR